MAFKYLNKYNKYYRLIYSIIAIVSLLLILIYQFSIKEAQLFLNTFFTKTISIIAFAAGITIMAACSRKYLGFITGFKKYEKSEKKEGLYITGLNGVVRHPLYAGTLLFIWSLFFLFPFMSNLICCTIITVYVFIGIGFEEKKLRMEYGNAYDTYAQKVPMIIPNVLRNKKNIEL